MAGRASLSFLGQEDISLSGDPEVTYFIEKYQGQTPFAYRVDRVIFDEQGVSFGSQNHRVIPRNGDLITNMTLYTLFPSPPPGVNVLDSVGTLMFQYIELYIGSELIERLYGEYIEMMFDLTVPKGKQAGLSFLEGKNLQYVNTPQLAYTVPIPFSVFKKGLPLCAFNDDVTIRIVWNPSTYFTVPPTLITTPFTAQLNIEYTYLAQNEIDFIRKSRFQIFDQIQLNQFFAPYGINFVQCQLDFYNPVKELFFVLQQDSARGYDYSNVATAAAATNSIGTGDLLSRLRFDFNTTERIASEVGSPQFLRIIQPLEFHTRVPDRIFYMYSFSLDPEGESPTGSVNLSRIQNQNLYLYLNPTPTNVNIRVYASSYNFLETANNTAKVTFSNFF
jgi:Large eukaryotic DNA virus major capsid protein/Major capsid protein N-terminus